MFSTPAPDRSITRPTTPGEPRRRLGRRLALPALALALIASGTTAALADHEGLLTVERILNDCNRSTDFCGFTPKSRAQNLIGPRTATTGVKYNCGPTDNQWIIAEKNTSSTTVSASVEVGASGGWEAVFQASFKVTYTEEWTRSHEYTVQDTVVMKPWHKAQLFFAPALQEVTGDYEVHYGSRQMGHYYWFVRNLRVVGPDPAGLKNEGYWVAQEPMTEADRANCPRVGSGLVDGTGTVRAASAGPLWTAPTNPRAPSGGGASSAPGSQ